MDDRREVLYSYWDEIKPFELITTPKDVIFSHEIRKSVIALLREGKMDEEDKKIRHALNAREIQQLLEKKETEKKEEKGEEPEKVKISLQKLYFHLSKLEEADLLKTVTILKEGKHNITYYGRTARIFLHWDPEKEAKKYTNAFSAIRRFKRIEDPKFKDEKLDNLLQQVHDYEKNRKERIQQWIIQQEPKLVENKFSLDEFTSLFDFLEILDFSNPEYIRIFKELRDYLNLDSLP